MYSFKNLDEIKKYQKVNYLNKFVILVITLIVLYFSFNLVDRGIEISKNYSPIIENHTVTDFMHHQCSVSKSDSATCAVMSPPTNTTQDDYSIAPCMLMYIGILVVVSFSLWGLFTALFKVLKSEHEMNSKLFDVQKDIYKETQMWELTKQKKEQENNTSKVSEKDSSPKIDKEVQKRIDEFENIEKVKLELKYKHELDLKEKEIQALKEMVKQNVNAQPSEQEKIN